jgi:hypothetical protein
VRERGSSIDPKQQKRLALELELAMTMLPSWFRLASELELVVTTLPSWFQLALEQEQENSMVAKSRRASGQAWSM